MRPPADQLLLHHVQELRRRLLSTAIIVLGVAIVAYFYRTQIVSFIAEPLHQPLIYTAPGGGFQFVMLICLAAGIVAALPVFIYNLVRFIEPALNRGKKRSRALSVLAVSTMLAGAGAAFAYLLVLPMSLHFFNGYSMGIIHPLISTSEYLSFVIGCLATFALIFQLPMLILIYNRYDRLPPGKLRRYRRHIIIGSLAMALVLPFTYDPFTQFVVAVPIIALYEFSILAVWLTNRKKRPTSAPKVGNGGLGRLTTPVQLG